MEKEIKQKAKRVFEDYSSPLKTCWTLNELEDIEIIYYGPGADCLSCAQEVASQVEHKYNHKVKLFTFHHFLTGGKEHVYPSYFNLNKMAITAGMVKTFSSAKTLIVCDDDTSKKFLYFGDKFQVSFKIFTPDKLRVKMLNVSKSGKEFGKNHDIAQSRTLKEVPAICVLSTERSTWGYAVQLYQLHKQTYPDTPINIVMMQDSQDHEYNIAANISFLRYCHKYVKDTAIAYKFDDLSEGNIWVIPQHKSYMHKLYSKNYFYTVSEDFDMLFSNYSFIGQNYLLKDIKALAEQNCKPDTITGVSVEFLDAYQEKTYPKWLCSMYRLYSRLNAFGLSGI